MVNLSLLFLLLLLLNRVKHLQLYELLLYGQVRK